LSGQYFSELPAKDQENLLNFELVIAVVYQATNDEIRELFARLQKGEKLTPPELRNSIASSLGDLIRAMAITHPFFEKSPFSKFRYKTDDLLAHAYGLRLYGGKRDIKAPDLAEMYIEFKNGVDQTHVSSVNSTLSYLDQLQTSEPKCIRTKWGFVDLFWTFSNHHGTLPAAAKMANLFKDFEQRRLKHTKNPRSLLLDGKSESDRRLYDYIAAFQAGGGTKENIKIRHDVLKKELC
jgi:hypothetical protein